MDRKMRWFMPWGAVLLTAAAVRLWTFAAWRVSPLRALGEIPGLDCLTQLELGALFRRGQGVFTPFKMLYLLAGGDPCRLTGWQLAAGVVAALCVTYAMLRLTGSRRAACAAGIVSALAGNALMYEVVPLQESTTLLLTAASFAALLWARKHRFAPLPAVGAGFVLGLAGTGRPSLLLWVLAALIWAALRLRRYRAPRRFGWLALGLLLVWIPVTAWNIRHASWPLPWYGSNVRYALSVAASPELADWNAVPAEPPPVSSIFGGLPRKAALLFHWRVIPDNLDYPFIAKRFAPVGRLIPPALLVLFGAAGLLTMLPRWRRKEGLVLLWFMTAAAVFTCYFPVGRYRATLTPVAAIAAVWWFKTPRPLYRWAFASFGAVLAAELALTPFLPARRRVSDYTLWMLALERSGAPAAEIDAAGWEALWASQGGVRETARLLQRLVASDRLAAAREVLTAYPGDDPCRRYFAALLELGEGRADACRDRLAALEPDDLPPELRGDRAFYLGEAYRLTGDPAAARQAWAPLMEEPRYRRLIDQRLSAE